MHAQSPRGDGGGDRHLHHCSVVNLDGAGILIEGESGSGKTALAFGLLEAARRDGRPAHFVADDQAMLSARHGELWAAAVAQIAGMAELRGFGIVEVEYMERTQIDLIASLVDDGQVVRMPLPETKALLGVEVPMLELPRRHESQCVRIVIAWLAGHPIFRGNGPRT